MKKTFKKVAPNSVVAKIIKYKDKRELRLLVEDDMKRFSEFSAHGNTTTDYKNIRSQLMYFTHQIEKGLSRKNFRTGFGKSAIENLVDAMNRMKNIEDGQKDDFYQNAVSALKKYKDKHLSSGNQIPNFELISAEIAEEIDNCTIETAGVTVIHSDEKKNNEQLNFKDLALNRHSIRDFKKDVHIEEKDLKEAIRISIKSPSVCNRQPTRLRVFSKKSTIEELLSLQGGFNGYDLPDKLILITGDLTVFLRAQERNQAAIDGGLFAMSLMYALEYKKIAACPLSTNISKEKTDKIRKIIKMEDSEVFIMFIACGIMEETVKVPYSYRTEMKNIAKFL